MTRYNLGLASVSFRQNSPEEILTAMSAAGLTHVEWGSDIHAPYTDAARLEGLAQMQKKYGVVCSSYGTYFRLGQTPLRELEGYIEAAKMLGTNVLRLWCGVKSGGDMNAVERDALIAECRAAEKIARECGAVLCMESHINTFTENLSDTLYLMETVGSEHFRMYWQPFQWLDAKENVKLARAVAPYTVHVHVFNWKNDDRLPLRDAIGTWRDYLAEFSGEKTLLLEFMPDGLIEALPREADALRNIVR